MYVLCEKTSSQASTLKYKTEKDSRFQEFCFYVLYEKTPYHATTWKYRPQEDSNFLQFRLCVLCKNFLLFCLYVLLKKNLMAPFYGCGTIASSLEPLRGGSLRFITKLPKISGTDQLWSHPVEHGTIRLGIQQLNHVKELLMWKNSLLCERTPYDANT